jgi:hypothetical protein
MRNGADGARTAEMVGLGRFELPTSRLSGGRSNQLSYRPALHYSPIAPNQRSGSASSVSENGITRGDGRSDRPNAPRLNESPGEPGIQALVARSRDLAFVDLDRLLANATTRTSSHFAAIGGRIRRRMSSLERR